MRKLRLREEHRLTPSHSQRTWDQYSNLYHGSGSADSTGAPGEQQAANGGRSAGHLRGGCPDEEPPTGAGPPTAPLGVALQSLRQHLYGPHLGSNPGPVPGSEEALSFTDVANPYCVFTSFWKFTFNSFLAFAFSGDLIPPKAALSDDYSRCPQVGWTHPRILRVWQRLEGESQVCSSNPFPHQQSAPCGL